MIKPNVAGAKRVATGAVVVATSALMLGVPFATAANAAPTAGTITSATPTHTNYQVNTTATINVTSTSTPTELEYTILSGPATSDGAAATFPSGVDCGSQTQCTLHNTGTKGTDQIRIFDGGTAGANSDYTASDPSKDVSVTFSGAPASVSLAPDTPSKTASQCQAFTATAKDSSNNPSGQANLTITATESVSAATDTPISFCAPLGSGGTSTTNSSSPFTNTATETVTTGDDGTVDFGVESSQAGTVTVKAAFGASAFDTSTLTVTGGATGANSVAHLAVSPTSSTGYVNSGNTYTVTATDSSGNPVVSGVTVQYEIATDDPDATGAGNYPTCGTINSADGTTSCTITNGGTAGTDHITFFVNQTSGSGIHSTGPDNGEPTATATATFNAVPAVGSITLTSPDATNSGTASSNSTIPTTQNSVTFTALVKDTSGNPLPGAVVSFTNGSYHASSPAITPQNGTATTGSNGTATFTVTDSAPADGTAINVTATVASHNASATATYATPVPTTFTVTPTPVSVANGGTVNETATVTDQFGNGISGQTITWSVTGRNNGKTGSGTTGANGTLAISYTDTAVNSASDTDTISATDTSSNAPSSPNATATVQYVTSTTASTVTLDVSGAGDGTTCPSSGGGTTANEPLSTASTVCALVKNSAGEVLAGKSVTFTVSKGTVGTSSTATGTTYSVNTNGNGIAVATVDSNVSGAQTVTATADSASATGTVTYAAPAPTAARNITLTPATATVAPGTSKTFTALVTDQYGNGVPNVTVNFSKSGPGNFGAVSSASAVTNAAGEASVTLTTASGDTGNGTVTATIGTSGTACGTTTGNCTDTAAYTVSTAGIPASVSLSAQSGRRVGQTETITATVRDESGHGVAHVIVRFKITGANSHSSHATTNSAGHATYTYTPHTAGTDHVSAYADVNGDGVAEGTEPSTTRTVHIAAKKITITKAPTLHATPTHGKRGVKVTFHGHGTKGATIALQYRNSHGHWVGYGHTKVNSHGTWKLVKHVHSTRTLRVREESQRNSHHVTVHIHK